MEIYRKINLFILKIILNNFAKIQGDLVWKYWGILNLFLMIFLRIGRIINF